MRIRLVMIALAAVFLTACSRGAAPQTQHVTAPPAAPAPAAPQAQPAADSRPEIDRLNDSAFQLIKDQNWTDAIAVAKRATEVDANSSAAYFNLGRAYLGSGQALAARSAFDEASRLTDRGNADVEYYRGTAAEADGDAFEAAVVFQMALVKFPADKEIAAALAALRQAHSELAPIIQDVDIDGDGKADRIGIDLMRVTITSSGGQTLYADFPFGSYIPVFADNSHPAQVYALPATTPLIDIQVFGCNAGPEHRMLWFDQAARTVRNVYSGPCGQLEALGNGRFVLASRAGVDSVGYNMHWDRDHFVDDGERRAVIADFVGLQGLRSVMDRVLKGETDGSGLFATPDLYREFQTRTGTGTWSAADPVDLKRDPVWLPLLKDGRLQCYLLYSPKTHTFTAFAVGK